MVFICIVHRIIQFSVLISDIHRPVRRISIHCHFICKACLSLAIPVKSQRMAPLCQAVKPCLIYAVGVKLHGCAFPAVASDLQQVVCPFCAFRLYTPHRHIRQSACCQRKGKAAGADSCTPFSHFSLLFHSYFVYSAICIAYCPAY